MNHRKETAGGPEGWRNPASSREHEWAAWLLLSIGLTWREEKEEKMRAGGYQSCGFAFARDQTMPVCSFALNPSRS
ncbi:MAG: hypothetical protein K0S45_1592 [Nitrospira sp.]|jgi:hypothetical protein|nr:hypothetical protein [Nitrospira sp.]